MWVPGLLEALANPEHERHDELSDGLDGYEGGGFDPIQRTSGKKKFKGEVALTNALIEVSEPTKPKVYFLTGHQESELDGQSGQSTSQIGFLTKVLDANK